MTIQWINFEPLASSEDVPAISYLALLALNFDNQVERVTGMAGPNILDLIDRRPDPFDNLALDLILDHYDMRVFEQAGGWCCNGLSKVTVAPTKRWAVKLALIQGILNGMLMTVPAYLTDKDQWLTHMHSSFALESGQRLIGDGKVATTMALVTYRILQGEGTGFREWLADNDIGIPHCWEPYFNDHPLVGPQLVGNPGEVLVIGGRPGSPDIMRIFAHLGEYSVGHLVTDTDSPAIGLRVPQGIERDFEILPRAKEFDGCPYSRDRGGRYSNRFLPANHFQKTKAKRKAAKSARKQQRKSK